MNATDLVVEVRALCAQVGSAEPDRLRLPADALTTPVDSLLEAFAQAQREELAVAYQVARAMDLAGHHVHAHSALKTLANRADGQTESLSSRLRSLEEELLWAGLIAEPLSEAVLPSRRDTSVEHEALSITSHQASAGKLGPLTDAYRRMRNPNRLWDAWRAVRAKRGAPGHDGITVAQFEATVVTQFQSIGRELREEAYRFGLSVEYDLSKSGGGKRKLRVPCVRDRVVLRSAAQVLAEQYEAHFSANSYAYRPGRSVQMALGAVRALMSVGRTWVGDTDIAACFDSVDHDKLMQLIEQQVRDQQFCNFMNSALSALADPETPGKGIPQGSPLSPVLCNVYLDALDHAANSRGLVMVRYADDFVILAESEAEARDGLRWCSEYLMTELALELNAEKTHIIPPGTQAEFLGGIIG